MQNLFIEAIHSKRKLKVTFYSKQDNQLLTRTCAPMDFGPSTRAHDKSNRFHFWDYDSDSKQHVLSLLPDQVESIELLDDPFDPKEFVTWSPKWIVARDWGAYS